VIFLSGLALVKRDWIEKFFDLWIDKVTDLIVLLETGKKNSPSTPVQNNKPENPG